MVIGESIRTSLEEVKGHPLRSFFTLIGVILGTLALVVVLSVLDGVEAAVWQGVEDLGMDGVISVSARTPTDRVEKAKAHLSRGLRVEDAKYYEDMFGKANAISYMLAKAIEPEKSVDAEDEANAVYARAHNGIHDVRINNAGKEILKERGNVQTILHNWRIVFFSIAGVSLLIGGVGIFSVLKISIGERLYEIGLRKSMGASDTEVFLQFLIESVTLSVVGAGAGLALGVLVVKLIARFFPAGLPVSLFGTTVSVGFAISIGLLAGLYPSISASRLEPVEALRA